MTFFWSFGIEVTGLQESCSQPEVTILFLDGGYSFSELKDIVIYTQYILLEEEPAPCPKAAPPFDCSSPVSVGFPCGPDGKEFACNAEDLGSILGLGRSPGEGNGYPLQYSCLENSMDRGTSMKLPSKKEVSFNLISFICWHPNLQNMTVFEIRFLKM